MIAEEKALLFIHALTSLHPGSGTTLGVVDLPVQRERHTGWPTIQASSLKGVLREACRQKSNGDEKEKWLAVFGPEMGKGAEEHAGALSLTDARILAFPVRSLKGVFAWVSCPAVLERLERDLLKLAEMNTLEGIPRPDKGKAACAGDCPLLVNGNRLVLEEFDFERQGGADGVAAWVAGHALSDEATRQRLKKQLVVLPDDSFGYLVRHATEVVARVGLSYETKTVKKGALFYQEFLPPETIFYSLVLATESRRKVKKDGGEEERMSAEEALGYAQGKLPEVLQIGGDETVGKGLCAVRLDGQGGEKRS